jgi:hypothetical protein
VAKLPGATFFHGSAWAKVLHGTYGFHPHYFVHDNGGDLGAVLPLMEIDSWLTGRRGVGLPFTDECAPLTNDNDSLDAIYDEATAFAAGRKWAYLESRGGKNLIPGSQASTSFWGHALELVADEGAQLAKVSKSAKGVIKKAAQSGLTIEVSNSMEALRQFHRLLCKTRKRHGVPPQPFVFFENIYRHILAENKGCVILAKSGDTAAAGAVYLHWGKSAIYKFAASDEAFKSLGANNLVMWRGIRWHAEQGFTQLNFGRSATSNEGLRKFKLGWGPSEYLIEYVRRDIGNKCFVEKGEESAAWHTRVFNMLPIRLSEMIGAFLYKHAA